jgi:hypothetical protein
MKNMKLSELFLAKHSNNHVQQIQAVDTEKRFPGIDTGFELARENFAKQSSRIDSLDSKANTLQTSAPSLIGVDLILLVVLVTLQRSMLVHLIQDMLLIPLLISCAITMFFAYSGYKIRSFQDVPTMSTLREDIKLSEEILKRTILESYIVEFEKNEKEVKKKQKCVSDAQNAFLAEIVIFSVILITQVMVFQFMR